MARGSSAWPRATRRSTLTLTLATLPLTLATLATLTLATLPLTAPPTHQALVLNGLRDRVVLRVDGGLKTGYDVVMGSLLGADEFGFGTIAMIAVGCVAPPLTPDP